MVQHIMVGPGNVLHVLCMMM